MFFFKCRLSRLCLCRSWPGERKKTREEGSGWFLLTTWQRAGLICNVSYERRKEAKQRASRGSQPYLRRSQEQAGNKNHKEKGPERMTREKKSSDLSSWLTDWLAGCFCTQLSSSKRLRHRPMSTTAAESSERRYAVLKHPPRQSEAEGMRGGGREAALLPGWGRSSAALPTSTQGGCDLFIWSSAQAPCCSVRLSTFILHLFLFEFHISIRFLQVTVIELKASKHVLQWCICNVLLESFVSSSAAVRIQPVC